MLNRVSKACLFNRIDSTFDMTKVDSKIARRHEIGLACCPGPLLSTEEMAQSRWINIAPNLEQQADFQGGERDSRSPAQRYAPSSQARALPMSFLESLLLDARTKHVVRSEEGTSILTSLAVLSSPSLILRSSFPAHVCSLHTNRLPDRLSQRGSVACGKARSMYIN